METNKIAVTTKICLVHNEMKMHIKKYHFWLNHVIVFQMIYDTVLVIHLCERKIQIEIIKYSRQSSHIYAILSSWNINITWQHYF